MYGFRKEILVKIRDILYTLLVQKRIQSILGKLIAPNVLPLCFSISLPKIIHSQSLPTLGTKSASSPANRTAVRCAHLKEIKLRARWDERRRLCQSVPSFRVESVPSMLILYGLYQELARPDSSVAPFRLGKKNTTGSRGSEKSSYFVLG